MSIQANQDSQSKTQNSFNKTQLINNFDNYLRNYKNVVELTITHHHIYIKRFFDWFDNHQLNSLKEVNFENLNKFLSQYHNKYSPASIRKLHFSLRAFFEYCRIYNIIEYNFRPILPQRRVYSKSLVPAVLSKAEINLLITETEKNKSDIGQRNYAILLLLICYGVRGCQIRNLELPDIHWEQNLILFRSSKNGNSVEQKLLPEVGNALINYITKFRQESNCQKVFLSFRNPNKGLTSSSSLSIIIGNLLDEAGLEIPQNALRGSHLFRHTFASGLLSEGEPIKNISDMLGHKLLSTTSIYTKIDIDNLKQVCLIWRESNEK